MEKYCNIPALIKQHHLVDFGFDTETICDKGDLSFLLRSIIDKTLPELNISITEEISKDGKHYVATLSTGLLTMEVFADTNDDWLPDTFFSELEAIPVFFNTGKLYYIINPAIGLTGQDAWYFCGTEEDLKMARKNGIPLIFPGENPMEAPELQI